MIRAVLDTSSLVPFESRRDLRDLAEAGAFTAIWSPWIIAELNRVLTWRWIDHTQGDLSQRLSRSNWDQCSGAAKTMMVLLHTTLEFVDPRPPYPPAWEELTDVWDYPIWAAAKVGQASYVVSENTHDYPPPDPVGRHMYEGIEYLSAHTFIALLIED